VRISDFGFADGGRAGIEDFGDVRVIHHRQRLAFGFEPGAHRRVAGAFPVQQCGPAGLGQRSGSLE